MTIFARSPRWLFALLLAGCGAERAQPPIADDTFVEVMVALRRAGAEHAGDASSFDAARDTILADAGVTDSLLYAYVEARADDPAALSEVFDDIRDALREPPEEEPEAEYPADTAADTTSEMPRDSAGADAAGSASDTVGLVRR